MHTRILKTLSAVAASALIVAGCATPGGPQGTGQQQPSATQQGAAAGAVIGGLLGFMRDRDLGDALKGAAVGAAVGAIIGKIIDHRRIRTAQQVRQQYGNRDQLVLNDIELSSEVLRPGQEGEVAVNYDVVSASGAQQAVSHTVEYYHGDNRLASNTQDVRVAPGGYRTVFPLNVPRGAEEGEYTLVARVNGRSGSDEAARSFRVIYARNDDGSLRVARVSAR